MQWQYCDAGCVMRDAMKTCVADDKTHEMQHTSTGEAYLASSSPCIALQLLQQTKRVIGCVTRAHVCEF